MSVKYGTRLSRRKAIYRAFHFNREHLTENLGVWAPLATGTALALLRLRRKASHSLEGSRASPPPNKESSPGKGRQTKVVGGNPRKKGAGKNGERGKTFAGWSQGRVCEVAGKLVERAGGEGPGAGAGTPPGCPAGTRVAGTGTQAGDPETAAHPRPSPVT